MALVTASILKTYIPELTGGTGADSALTSLIDRCETQIARFLGFGYQDTAPSLDQTTRTLYVDAPMSTNSMVLQLPIKPLISVASVHTDPDRVYGSDTLLDPSEYELDLPNSRIILKTNVATRGFYSSYRSNKIVCDLGYTSSPPNDLIHAICIMASQAQRAKATSGKLQLSQRGTSIRPAEPGISQEVKALLYPLRSPSVIL
tara:strand:+ start:1560 stop:2168 length:609 start_codon:yes stop_codon:yes gene_type:complete